MDFNYDITTLMFIFMRLSGCVLFNPVFGRKNIPMIYKIGLTLVLTLFIYNVLPEQNIETKSVIVYSVLLIKELLIGFVIGYIMNLFLSVIILGGELIDMQIGISMSKIYDPASNISMPVSASVINAMFMLAFFAANGHLTLIRIFMYSCEAFPYGKLECSPQLFAELAKMFSQILIYSVKLALPILAAELIAEMGVGILMKAVPQINVFVVNIQLKFLLGFIMILILVPPYSSFLERLMTLMFDNINRLIGAFG